MSKFFIHKDDQQQGPFTSKELKDLKITRETMVWFEGAEDWKKAVEIEVLQEILKSIPPPLIDIKTEDEPNPAGEAKSPSKNNVIILVILAVLLFGGLGYYIYTSQKAKQVEMLRQIEEQKIKIQELEDIKTDRLAKEQKIDSIASQRQLEFELLNYEYNQAIMNLRAAEIGLDEIQKFKLLRTASKRQQQIQQQLEYIMTSKNEVDRLKNKIDNY